MISKAFKDANKALRGEEEKEAKKAQEKEEKEEEEKEMERRSNWWQQLVRQA